MNSSTSPSSDHKYNLLDNLVEGGDVNINNTLALPKMLDKEASTDIDLVLLSSIDSYDSGSVNSMDWTSLESVSSPVEMLLYGPLPLRSSGELMALR
ncbi:unnamed protein product [Dibothriocephalus latus]|uniref:Uncharacterized protein n=1 Tax=Dibothriocephalus latus TaxID=60516 RepID=A0A3P7NDF1_DIBLA|nr:unnamed protein product [Dibothriocephalus latus]